MAEIQVRELNTADFWRLLNIIRKGGKEAIVKLQSVNTAEDDNTRAMVLLDVGMEYAEKELTAFLADLAGLSVDEYMESGFDTTLAIIEQLIEKEDVSNFTRRVVNLAGKFSEKSNRKPATAAAAAK